MEKRRLGQSDLHLAPIMLGGNVFGWMIDEKTSFGILDAFIDAGFNAIDTSDSYARWLPGSPGGESETIIGSWLKRSGNRDRVLIATKVGEDMGEGRSLKRDYILRECEALAATPASRSHRSLPDPFRRRGHRAGRDDAGLRAAGSRRQSTRDWRLEHDSCQA
jgi:Aldo/keto reductase family